MLIDVIAHGNEPSFLVHGTFNMTKNSCCVITDACSRGPLFRESQFIHDTVHFK